MILGFSLRVLIELLTPAQRHTKRHAATHAQTMFISLSNQSSSSVSITSTADPNLGKKRAGKWHYVLHVCTFNHKTECDTLTHSIESIERVWLRLLHLKLFLSLLCLTFLMKTASTVIQVHGRKGKEKWFQRTLNSRKFSLTNQTTIN